MHIKLCYMKILRINYYKLERFGLLDLFIIDLFEFKDNSDRANKSYILIAF